MKKSTVTPFIRDEMFYFIRGRDCYLAGNYLDALKYINWAKKVLKPADKALKYGDDLVIGDIYSKLGDIEQSNYHYYSALSAQFLSQPAYRGLGENFLTMGNEPLARYYLELCKKINPESPHAIWANHIIGELNSVSKEIRKKTFTVIKGGKDKDNNKLSRDVVIGLLDEFMEQADYKSVIDVCKVSGEYNNAIIRSAAASALIATENYDDALFILKHFGTDNIDDIANKIQIYKDTDDYNNYNLEMQKLNNFTPNDEETCFKVGITLATYGEYKKALPHLNKYYASARYDYNLMLLHAKIYLCAGEYEKARQKFLNLKTYNPSQSYILNKYIKMCINKTPLKLERTLGLTKKEQNEVKTQIKNFLLLEDQELKKAFNENEEFFYFLLTFDKDSSLRNLLITRLSKMSSKQINDYFRCFLLKNCAKQPFKLQIVLNRLSLDSVNYCEYIKDDIFYTILQPNKKILQKLNKTLLNVTLKCTHYLVYYGNIPNVDLRYQIVKLDNAGICAETDENVICAYLILSKYSDKQTKQLKNICNFFKVTKQQIYAFAEYFKLEI